MSINLLQHSQGKGKQQTYWLQGVEKDLNTCNPRQFTDQTARLKRESNTQFYSDTDASKKNPVLVKSPQPDDMVNFNNLNHVDSKNHKVHLNNKEFQ